METGPVLRLANGDEIPRIGFGTWQIRPGEETRKAVRSALAAGYRHVDTARVYNNEADVGDAIRDSGLRRHDVWVTTKLYNTDQGYEGTLKACRESIRRLGLDYVDLYLVHWPVPERRIESWRAMVKLQQDGFCRTIGVSNYLVRHLDELVRNSDVLPLVNQIELHPFLQQRVVRKWCEDKGVAVAAYSPLTRAWRIGHRVVREVAERVGRTPAQVLLRWGIEKGAVVIAKSTHAERIAENLDVIDWELGGGEVARLDELDEGLHTCWDPTDVP